MTDSIPDYDEQANGCRNALPVFEIDPEWYGSLDQVLPTIWLSEPRFDENGTLAGRRPAGRYPDSPDPDGFTALRLGACYYDEGMGYSDVTDYETRIRCFQAAEILYLHAAAADNPIAFVDLGYVYSYDRCEGRYFVDTRNGYADVQTPYPREARALECFERAAEAGDAQACYKVGDLHKKGAGCTPSDTEAFAWYTRAYELGQDQEPVCWGSAAARLGECYELGRGCPQDFAQAQKWYELAVAGIGIAVRSGNRFYEKPLANAKAAAKRMAQELQGTY